MGLSLQCSPETGGEKIVNWTQNHWKGKSLKAIMCKFGLGATVYPSGSTEVLFISSEEQILAANIKQVKAKVFQNVLIKSAVFNREEFSIHIQKG